MLYEPTTLASTTALLATSLREEYGIDPEPVFARAGLALPPADSPQLRYPLPKTRALWAASQEASGDESIGLKTGWYAKPAHLYAFGYSWMASSTLLEALQRLMRYFGVMSTSSVEFSLAETADSYALSATFPDDSAAPAPQGLDCGMTAILALCDIVAEKPVRPIRVETVRPAAANAAFFKESMGAPVRFGADAGAMHFDKATLRELLPHGAPDVARATDRVAEQYLETLDPHKVASQVRRLLIGLLPSGKADQSLVSERLNRSPSTLQRQLQAEGVTYREVLESTQRSLAETHLREGRYSQSQIAYLLGFSEQSNFSRAFKRWTGMTPRQYVTSLQGRSPAAH